MADVNWEHVTAIAVLGIGGWIAMFSGYSDATFVLWGTIAGYVFRNGKNSLKK